MTKKPDIRLVAAAIIVIGLGAIVGVSMLFDVMPAEHTITTASGDIVTSGSIINYAEGLELTLEWQGYVNGMAIDCSLWDIEQGTVVEVGAFSVTASGALIWTFTLDNVRNNTNLYKLVLTGDATGETFTFYIMGEESEIPTTTTTTPTTTTPTTTTPTTTTPTVPPPIPPVYWWEALFTDIGTWFSNPMNAMFLAVMGLAVVIVVKISRRG